MDEERIIERLIRAAGVAVEDTACRLTQQERGELLSDGSRGRVIERPAGVVIAEIVSARCVAGVIPILPIRPEVVACLDLVPAARRDSRQGRLERVDVVS